MTLILFRVWLLWLSVVFVRFVHSVECSSNSFVFIAVRIPLYDYIANLFTHFLMLKKFELGAPGWRSH